MLKINTGRLKTYTLILLIISSLILSGSLWFEDYHGFSAFFAWAKNFTFSRLINIGKDDMQSKYDKLFVPSEIIVNNGEEGHWILYPSQQSGDELWKIAKGLLKNISNQGTELKINPVDKSEWSGMISKRSIIFNFNYSLNSEILSTILKSGKKNDNIENINKLVITILGENLIFYVEKTKDDKSIYEKYSLPRQDIISDEDFEKIFSDTGLIKYTLLKEVLENINLNLTYNDDVFVPIFSFVEANKKAVILKQVEFKPQIKLEQSDEIAKLVEKMFGGNDFSKFIKNDGTNIFIDEKNNTLKLYPNGYIEFEYMEDQGLKLQEISFESALKTAVSTTEKFGSTSNMYISAEQGENGQYKFCFDYIINGIPVIFNKVEKPAEEGNAITITINKDKLKLEGFILGCNTFESEQKFSSDHDSIINAVFEDAGENAKKIKIDDIKLAYKLSSGDKAAIYPAWVARYKADDKQKLITVKASEDR